VQPEQPHLVGGLAPAIRPRIPPGVCQRGRRLLLGERLDATMARFVLASGLRRREFTYLR
jgi:hypothetical protein